jgi:hypothetical protein
LATSDGIFGVALKSEVQLFLKQDSTEFSINKVAINDDGPKCGHLFLGSANGFAHYGRLAVCRRPGAPVRRNP